MREEPGGVGGGGGVGGWNLAHVGGGDPDASHWSFRTSPGAKTCSLPEWSWMCGGLATVDVATPRVPTNTEIVRFSRAELARTSKLEYSTIVA